MNRALALLLPAALLAGCASSTVTLLNGEAGAPVGAVAIVDPKTGSDLALVDSAGGSARLGGGRPVPRAGDPATAEQRNSDLLATMPAAPRSFVLEFPEGSTVVAPASRAILADVKTEIAARGAGVDVQIEGHTDRVGTLPDNDQLSRDRARAMRDALAAEGLIPANTRFVGRGERQPLPGHATADGEADPANRRVVIVVR
jgi:outer membrane protein OmpA-like peptidoglycan-associated protein